MSDDEIIAVVQAHKEGKQIEVNLGMGWLSLDQCQRLHYPNFLEGSFRVKPEPRKPREWRVFLFPDGTLINQNKLPGDQNWPTETLRVREVIEE